MKILYFAQVIADPIRISLLSLLIKTSPHASNQNLNVLLRAYTRFLLAVQWRIRITLLQPTALAGFYLPQLSTKCRL